MRTSTGDPSWEAGPHGWEKGRTKRLLANDKRTEVYL